MVPSPPYIPPMCNAYNLRHRNEAILDIARAMQRALAELPEFPPRHRIGIKQRGLILRPSGREKGVAPWPPTTSSPERRCSDANPRTRWAEGSAAAVISGNRTHG